MKIDDIDYPPLVEKNDPDLMHVAALNYKLANDGEFLYLTKIIHLHAHQFDHRVCPSAVYSSVGHLHLPPPITPRDFCYDTSMIGHTKTLPYRRRMSQEYPPSSLNCLPNGSSPTPSIPPPMSAISTHAYSSLQCSNYLHI
jgi:hypothetical protein